MTSGGMSVSEVGHQMAEDVNGQQSQLGYNDVSTFFAVLLSYLKRSLENLRGKSHSVKAFLEGENCSGKMATFDRTCLKLIAK